MRKFAVFDIDGTLFRWQLYHEIILEMAKRKLLPPELTAEALSLHTKWRSRFITFDEFDKGVVKQVTDRLDQISTKNFDDVVRDVYEKHKDEVYVYSKQLLEKLKAEKYFLIAISGSQAEVVKQFTQYHGFDAYVGQTWGRRAKAGRFTSILVESYREKDRFLREIVTAEKLTYKNSYAIGDSASDIPLLQLVEQPIAFNPSAELLEKAKQQRWPIVIERKSIGYKLTAKGDEYVLAATNFPTTLS
jgi:HAD superfamily phosphoserine phosphatase-like hydrolase